MNKKQTARRQFIEDVGDVLEEHGLTHMAGRVLGALMICVPTQMSMDQLADQLQASKGSISSATQMLLRMGIIEKISLPGHRRHYFQLRSNLWSHLIEQDAEHLDKHRMLAEDGLAMLEGEPVEMKRRLLEMQVFCDFIEEEWPGLLDRWEKREKEVSRSLPEYE